VHFVLLSFVFNLALLNINTVILKCSFSAKKVKKCNALNIYPTVCEALDVCCQYAIKLNHLFHFIECFALNLHLCALQTGRSIQFRGGILRVALFAANGAELRS
jgi:hypothetical protein